MREAVAPVPFCTIDYKKEGTRPEEEGTEQRELYYIYVSKNENSCSKCNFFANTMRGHTVQSMIC